MSVAQLLQPIIRPEVEHMLEAEELIRRARRRLIDQRVLVPEGAMLTEAEITAAISHLVAARHSIVTTNSAFPTPSKDL